MAILFKASGEKKYTPIPEGTYTAICYSVIDLGVQYNEKFGTSSRKVLFTWELPDETIDVEGEQKPKAISKEYTMSLNDKANLKKDLEAWRGKAFTKEELNGFDPRNVLGKACQLQILHKTSAAGNVRANISTIMGLPKGMKLGEPTNPIVYFDLNDPKAIEEFNSLPEWVKAKISQSETWKALKEQHEVVNTPVTVVDNMPVDDGEDDLPF